MSKQHTTAKILIVDDDPVSQIVVMEAIEKLGHEAVCASSGEEAWELLQKDTDLSIAFIDWLMPGMDGPELCRKIKNEIAGRYIYAIMVTSKDKKEDVIAGLAAGADDYVSKPVHQGELASRMQAGERVLNYEYQLRIEKEKSERLLQSILPSSIAERLKAEENPISDFHPEASILFVDIVGFTEWCMRMDAPAMMAELTDFFAGFDAEIEAHGLEKIKSIGDAYMIASGLPEPRPNHAHDLVRLAISIKERVAEINRSRLHPWAIRSGIASGSVIAGVVGQKRFIYDTWGHTVNLASRLEALAPTNTIIVSQTTRDIIKDEIECVGYQKVVPKGFGEQMAWKVIG